MSCISIICEHSTNFTIQGKTIYSSFKTRFTTLPLNITTSHPLARHHAYVSIFFTTNIKEALNANISFDMDSTTCIVDNSVNVHIWTVQSNLVPGSLVCLVKLDNTGVASIGGVELSLHSIGGVHTNWKNDGKPHNNILKGALFVPDSPVNLLSVTALAEQLKDDTSTWIKTRRYKSTFTWDSLKWIPICFRFSSQSS